MGLLSLQATGHYHGDGEWKPELVHLTVDDLLTGSDTAPSAVSDISEDYDVTTEEESDEEDQHDITVIANDSFGVAKNAFAYLEIEGDDDDGEDTT